MWTREEVGRGHSSLREQQSKGRERRMGGSCLATTLVRVWGPLGEDRWLGSGCVGFYPWTKVSGCHLWAPGSSCAF